MANEPIAVRAGVAAQMLGVSKPKLYELAKRDDFQAAFKCGGCLMFSVAQLRSWVEEQARKEVSA